MQKISVIVPVYKVEKTLDACVKSILAQTYTDIEVILVDDGSPDACPAMCEELAKEDGRIKVVHRENGGLSAARNTGIENASGELITFVDSDDMIAPETVAVLYDTLIKAEADMSVCMYEIFQNDDDIKNAEIYDGVAVADARDLLLSEKVYDRTEAWGKLYKKEIFSFLRFKEGIYYEDTHIAPYILERISKVAFNRSKLYYYRKNPELPTIMNAKFSLKKLCILDIFGEQIRDIYKRVGMCPAYGVALEQLFGSVAKARVLKKELSIGMRFYKYYFKLLPTMLFAPKSQKFGFKQKMVYLSLILPFGVLNSYYRKNVTVKRYDELNNL
ncbi:MAG: glycosyltransferase family 2 protein [Clostridia bacterium]|nr:glycosyltransferase family 2 protein [Clostridia bacterium]